MRRFARRLFTFVAVGGVSAVVLMMGMLNLGHWLSAPRSAPQEADIIVVLGGGEKDRVRRAIDLYKDGYARRVLLTGLTADAERRGDFRLHWRTRFLLAGGVPFEVLLFDDRSRNSYEEAQNAARLMKTQQWRSALVVSDPPHLRRLEMIWQKVASQYGIEYRLIASEPKGWDAAGWWREKVWAKFVGMELVKLAYYATVY
ncbi:conserved exported protein of unknown function [Candidatus Nitrospira inopinata]|uniref:DUF218 domain-containing protein n=2 Tax=Candidatus Nitrospira inopinata TaxID=1715989 RepID=A0A0S4KQG1_9BACT|nr:conserved exported protein of unknown function [Candidatus Nitrospira inopinata]